MWFWALIGVLVVLLLIVLLQRFVIGEFGWRSALAVLSSRGSGILTNRGLVEGNTKRWPMC
jgi:hypothetical protein